MNDPEHLQAFTLHKTNCEWWASYRNSHSAPFDFSDQEFDGFTFSERVFVGCSFQSCEFTNCTFDRAHLQGTNFIRCNFIKCSFTNAITATESTTFQQCTFVRCSALGHVLINIHPLDADFQECIIKEISISEKHLSRWRFKDCIVNSMNFFKCKIDSFSIEGSEAEKSKVTNLNMTGSSIDYFVISNCNLTGLAIKDTSGLFSMSSSSLATISAEGAKISITTKECQIESFSGNSKEANLK